MQFRGPLIHPLSPLGNPRDSFTPTDQTGLDAYSAFKVKIDGSDSPKRRLVKGRYKPRCRDCAIYFSIPVFVCFFHSSPPKKSEFFANEFAL